MKPFWSWSQAAAPEAMAAPAAPKGAGVPVGTSEPKKLESRLRCLSGSQGKVWGRAQGLQVPLLRGMTQQLE